MDEIRKFVFTIGVLLIVGPAMALAYILAVGPSMGFGELPVILGSPLAISLVGALGTGVVITALVCIEAGKTPVQITLIISLPIFSIALLYIAMSNMMNFFAHPEVWFRVN